MPRLDQKISLGEDEDGENKPHTFVEARAKNTVL
jgi:hypothetical protein